MTQLDDDGDYDHQMQIKIFPLLRFSMKELTKSLWQRQSVDEDTPRNSNHAKPLFFLSLSMKKWCLLSAKQQTRYDYENNGTGNDSKQSSYQKWVKLNERLIKLQQKLF